MSDDFIIEAIGDKRIQCLDDLLSVTWYSKELREVVRSESNMRTTTMKTKQDHVKQTENLQIKAKLKPLSTLVKPDMKEILMSVFWSNIPVRKWPVTPDGPKMWQIISSDRHIDRIEAKGKKYLQELTDRTMRLFELLIKHKPQKLVYANIGDYWNSDGENKTTHGTPQHNLYSEKESFRIWLEHQRNMIAQFATELPIEAIFIGGNHDQNKMQCLGDALSLYFSRSNNVTVDSEPYSRKYRQWGNTTIGYQHGDAIKLKQVPLSMMSETKLGKDNYMYQGHIHQKRVDSFGNVNVHTVPSPARPSEREKNNWRTSRWWIYWQVFDKRSWLIAEYKQ